MAKAPTDTIKYNIRGEITIDGAVEKPDVVGAIFGQAEGLLGEELELRDLQKTGRIGRIEVDITTKAGKSTGTLVVPSSLDMVETAIIASAVETVDRVGPCNAKITIKDIEDARSAKRKLLINRAQELLKRLMSDEIPETAELTDEVRKSVQLSEITNYKGLPAGPSVKDADSIIIVEGRADVLNLLKGGIKNAVAVGGTNIPPQIVELAREKTAIAFIDGDRGGDMILKELCQVADIDFAARAPPGKEVEELGKKEVVMALRRKVPVDQVRAEKATTAAVQSPQAAGGGNSSALLDELKSIKGKLVARLFDKEMKQITEVEIKDLINSLAEVKPDCVVFDGIVTQRLVDSASRAHVKTLVGINKSAISITHNIQIVTEK
ncbi:MAG: hypothetical protein MSIBF_01875 [Candidatus Altiarchaeales archaeon IMC4]|nr:MAG: hypothetical protein MSIBF_01875 [Candidatus Altiarchaeales archaeon IMC4]